MRTWINMIWKLFRMEEIMESQRKVAIVIGHTDGEGVSKDEGAYSEHLNVAEYDYWLDFSRQVDDIADIFTHTNATRSYSKRQSAMAERTKDYDLVLELHFNSSDNPLGHGCEALHYGSNKKMKKIAEFFCSEMNRTMGMRNRGAKASFNGRGYGFLKKTKNDALILEPFFGSNVEDVRRFKLDVYAVVIENLINKYYEGAKTV